MGLGIPIVGALTSVRTVYGLELAALGVAAAAHITMHVSASYRRGVALTLGALCALGVSVQGMGIRFGLRDMSYEIVHLLLPSVLGFCLWCLPGFFTVTGTDMAQERRHGV